jgi:hypothetical protein
MLEPRELRILQNNVQKSREVFLASLFQDPGVLEYDILAIQEPWRNPYVYTSYHPLKTHFQLTYLADATTRACLYINKRLDPSTLSVSYVSKDIISLTIRNPTPCRSIHIANVYNEVGTDTLNTLQETIGAWIRLKGLCCFDNVPARGKAHRSTYTHTRLPAATPHRTRDSNSPGGESTIDLTFASEDLAPLLQD